MYLTTFTKNIKMYETIYLPEVKYGRGVPLDSNKYVINIANKTTDVFRLKETNHKTFFKFPLTGTLRNSYKRHYL